MKTLVSSTRKRKRILANKTLIFFKDGSNMELPGQKEESFFKDMTWVRGYAYQYKGRTYAIKLVDTSLCVAN